MGHKWGSVGKPRLGQVLNFWLKCEERFRSPIKDDFQGLGSFVVRKTVDSPALWPLLPGVDLPYRFRIHLAGLQIHACVLRKELG